MEMMVCLLRWGNIALTTCGEAGDLTNEQPSIPNLQLNKFNWTPEILSN